MTDISLPARRLLRRSEAANYVQNRWGYPLSPKTLAKLAVVGGGPKFRKASRFPLYEVVWLDEWVRSKLSLPVSSTSELARRTPPRDRAIKRPEEAVA
jgi:hypothetical protein